MMDNKLLEVFENLDIPAYGSSRERTDRIYQLAMQKAGLPMVYRVPKKKTLLVAAVLAAILLVTLLAGAGYVYSQYFSRMYREDPAYEKMMAAEQEPNASIPVIDGGLETLPQASWEEMMELLDSMEPGDINYGMAALDGESDAVSAIRSENYGLFRSSSGTIGRRTYWESAPQQLLDALTEGGTVTMTLDDPQYILKRVSFEPTYMLNYLWICYEDRGGNEITVSLSYGLNVLRPFEEVSAQDVTVDGRVFTLANRDGIFTLDYYLGGYYRVELSLVTPTEDNKALLLAAEHLTIHNTGAIQPKSYSESISSFPDPRLQAGRIEIEKALQKAEEAGLDEEPAWTQDNISITLNRGMGEYFVNYTGEDFSYNLLKYTPVSTAPPFEKEPWFPAEIWDNHTIYYNSNRVNSMSWDGKGDEYYKLQYYNAYREPAVTTQMDALVQFLHSENHQPYLKQEKDGNLYLFCHPLNGVNPEETVVVYSVVLEDSNYHIYRLFMPRSKFD